MTLANLEKFLLFLILLFLPTQLGKHFWPQFSLVYSLPIDYLSPTIYFWDLLVIFLLLVFLLQRKFVKKGALNLFLLFILTQLLSLIPATQGFDGLSLGAGLVRLEQYLIAGLFGVYLAAINLREVRSLVFWSLGLSIMGESALATAQFLKGETLNLWLLGERSFSLSTPGIAKFDFYGTQFLRPYATFPHPNVLAAFMVVILPLLSFLRKQESIKNGSRIKYGMTVVAVLVGGISTILTVSRVVLVAGLVEALLLLRKKILVWLMLGVILISPYLYTRFSAVFNFDNLSILRREQLTEVAWDMFLAHPVLGAGLNNFIPQASDQLLVGPSRFLQPVHNIFLLALAETGILGLLGFLGFIGYPLFKLLKLNPKPFTLNPILLLWGVIIFLGLFDHYFLTLPQGYRLLFLVWGISISMLEWKT